MKYEHLIENIINQGDASDNIWKGGVYAGQKFVYEPSPTTIDYILRNGALYDKAGVKVDPALINPGFYIRDTNAPMGMQPPGTSNIFDDPQVSYCDEVEFVWPDTLRLKFPGESMIAEVIASDAKDVFPIGVSKDVGDEYLVDPGKGKKYPPPVGVTKDVGDTYLIDPEGDPKNKPGRHGGGTGRGG